MTEEQIDKIIQAINTASQNNTVSIVLQVLTILISIGSIVVASIISVRSIRNQNYIEIIARQRLEDYNNIRKYLAEFITILSIIPSSINEDYLEKFENAYNTLLCHFKPQYDEDKSILKIMADIRNEIYSLYKNASSINALAFNPQDECSNLRQKVIAYNAANWECVKEEAGKTRMSHDNFKNFYKECLKNQ